MSAAATMLGELLRSPREIARRCQENDELVTLAAVSLGVTVLGAAVFGAVIGSFRGDLQILYSAVKLPAALLSTLAITAPALYAFAAYFGRAFPARFMFALVLSAIARSSLVLLALAPLLWLAVDFGVSYHGAALLAAGCYAVSGLAALGVLLRGLGAGSGRFAAAVACGLVMLVAGGQTAWAYRPFLGRPAQEDIPFVRAREGSFADSLWWSAHSAAGIYARPPRELR